MSRPAAWTPLLVALAAFLADFGLLLPRVRAAGGGRLVYVLDDTYIHMAMAKNLARHGVFGLTPFEFTSSSSSPLWTLLLATADVVVGARDSLPMVIDLATGAALLACAHHVLRARGLPAWLGAGALLAVVALTPLAPLTFTGQEHLLHAAMVVVLLDGWAGVLAGEGRARGALLALTGAAVLTRYETLFLAFAVGAALLGARRLREAAALAAAALAPALLFGSVAIAHGWRVLPYSVLLKAPALEEEAGHARALVPFLHGYGALAGAPHVLVLVILAGGASLALLRLVPRSREAAMGGLFVASAVLHMGYARTGWFYRYEAYLVAAGVVTVVVVAGALARRLAATGADARPSLAVAALSPLLAAVVLAPGVDRAIAAHVDAPRAARNIYLQQYQVARFLAAFYPGQTVGANDVGAIDYLADLRTVDLSGLGCREVAEARLSGKLDPAFLQSLAERRGMKLAVLYTDWFAPTGGLPPAWVVVGRWRVPDNVVLGSDTVTFYAVDPAEAPRLLDSLRAFAPHLPPQVTQSGPYTRREN